MGQLGVADALRIGLSQAAAIIPGVSRSGSTITMARLLGVDRQDAANFSFLMATPIIAGAGLVEARKILHAGIDATLVSGFVAAAVFGLISIAALVKFVQTRSYKPFALYRILAAVVVIGLAYSRS